MMQDETNETILRVKAALKSLPPANPRAVARVLSAVHGRTPQPTPRWRELLDWMQAPSFSFAGAAGMVAVALFAGYIANGRLGVAGESVPHSNAYALARNGSIDSSVQPSNTVKNVPVAAASVVADAERVMPVQFVFDFPNAHTVSVVGDFNDWTVD
ncbi:MAG: hypothetical protein ABJB74_05235, partial [Gemmatimonas sp.]